MEPQIVPIHRLLRLNSRLFVNCLEGLDDEMARRRVSQRTNNVAFIASHVVDARYFLAGYLGVTVTNPFKELLGGLKSIAEFTEFPVIREILAAWHDVSGILEERLARLTAAELRAPSPQSFPIDDASVLGGLAFLIQHESYHLGQLGLLRKCLGLEAMSYAAAHP